MFSDSKSLSPIDNRLMPPMNRQTLLDLRSQNLHTEMEDIDPVSAPNLADKSAYTLAQQSPLSPTEVVNIRNHSSSAMANDYLSFDGPTFSLNKIIVKMSSSDRTVLHVIVSEMDDFLIRVTFKLKFRVMSHHGRLLRYPP